MVKVFVDTDKEFYMDGYLKQNLDIAKAAIKKDWDMLFVYDGMEGSGKSVKAMQDAFYCDPSLDLNRIVFTPNSFRKGIVNAEQYQAVVYDEAYTGLSSRATMSLINRTLIKMLAEIRQKNLFVFVVLPCFFDLDKYVALWRSRALIHVYTKENFQRGSFAFYNADRKKDLYVNGKKYYSYYKPKPNFIGRFTNHYVVDEKEYRKKKKESLIEREKKEEEAHVRREVEGALFNRVMEMENLGMEEKRRVLDMPNTTFYRKVKQYKDIGEFS
jgi:hypothetical protein